MNKTFFDNLCSAPGVAEREINYLPLPECQCDGKNFFGMPSITFEVKNPVDPKFNNYNLNADDILLFPKVDINLRQTYCNVGLWNLI